MYIQRTNVLKSSAIKLTFVFVRHKTLQDSFKNET